MVLLSIRIITQVPFHACAVGVIVRDEIIEKMIGSQTLKMIDSECKRYIERERERETERERGREREGGIDR